jgi:hypothetical protein
MVGFRQSYKVREIATFILVVYGSSLKRVQWWMEGYCTETMKMQPRILRLRLRMTNLSGSRAYFQDRSFDSIWRENAPNSAQDDSPFQDRTLSSRELQLQGTES